MSRRRGSNPLVDLHNQRVFDAEVSAWERETGLSYYDEPLTESDPTSTGTDGTLTVTDAPEGVTFTPEAELEG